MRSFLFATLLPVLYAAGPAPDATAPAAAPSPGPATAPPAVAGQTKAAPEKKLTIDELRAIQGHLKAFDTLTVDFTQTKATKISEQRGKKGVQRDGKAVFSRSGKFKWMLETPTKEYKIYDGKAVYDYDPEGKTAARYPITGGQAADIRQIVDIVLNFDTLLKRYDLVQAVQHGDLLTVDLKPKVAGEIEGVELKLSLSDAFVSYLALTMSNGTRLTDEFRNPSHKAVDAGAFAIPKGVKINDSI